MRDQTRNQLFWQADGASPNLRQVWVAFADMVGFTRLGERIDPHDLGGLVTRLTDLALETVAAPVRLVKTIGDAAMLVSPVPGPLVEAALTLVERADEQGDGFPPLRAGLAGGVALSRGGDWYGRPVNLASRVTAVARAGSVLATDRGARCGRRRPLFVVARRPLGAEGIQGAGAAVPGAPGGGG